MHFFDRELWEAAGQGPDRLSIDKALKTLLLGTDAPLYCGLSLIWENPALRSARGSISSVVTMLIELGIIEPVSQHPTIEEFIETRRELYKHDRGRYPHYFRSGAGGRALGPKPGHLKRSSATQFLEGQLYSWSQDRERDVDLTHLSSIRRVVRNSLRNREDKAITFAMFRPSLTEAGVSSPAALYELRRQISKGYTSHYMNHAYGDIPTGISGLSYFDDLSVSFPDYDIELMGAILCALGYENHLKTPFDECERCWESIGAQRGRDFSSRSSAEDVRFILRVLYDYVLDKFRKTSQDLDFFAVRTVIKQSLMHKIKKVQLPPDIQFKEFFSTFAIRACEARRGIERDKDMRKAVDVVTGQMGATLPRVILSTTTNIERDTVLRLSEAIIGTSATPEFGARRSYFRLGAIGGVDVFLVQCEMGSTSPGASLSTIGDAIDDIRPKAAIMVGIAFGVNEKKQAIGDIIVARQLQLYELARIGTTVEGKKSIVSRGDKVTASTQILSRLRLAEAGWSGRKVRYGVILSGEKLVDNVDYRSELEAIGGEVEGGEMEGAGLYAAAIDRNVDWIIVKSICDWADGNKSTNKARRQALAAEQSTEFVLRALQQGGFVSMNVLDPSPRI